MKKQKRESAQNVARTVIPFEDKLKVFLMIVGAFALVTWVFIVVSKNKKEIAVDYQLQKWKIRYNLTDHQAAQLRKIELSFHGNGNPFTFLRTHSREETREHHLFMSKLMSPEDGERFFNEMEKIQNH